MSLFHSEIDVSRTSSSLWRSFPRCGSTTRCTAFPPRGQRPDYIELFWHEAPGAAEYRVYKAQYGGRPGYIATVGETTYKDHNVAISVSEGAPKYIDPFRLDDGNGGIIEDFPGAVCLFEQRLVFASTPRRPQTLWMSKSGDYGNFATYTPQTDDSPIELTLASSEVSEAKWMAPLRSLIIGTSGVEWEISSSQGAFSAKTAQAKPQSFWGSSLGRAMVVGNIILHVSRSGSQVRNLQYDFTADSYGGIDLSIMAEHLFRDGHIVAWACQKSPDSIIWAVRSDGTLLGLTFQNEHQIAAWHRHDTQGAFLAVCSTPHGNDDSLFAVIRRDGKHFLERMAQRYTGGGAQRAVFLDSALTYVGSAVSSVSGLGHLNGKTVAVWGDGRYLGAYPVFGGRVSFGVPCSAVVAGLAYTADLETMPVELVAQSGTSVTLKRYINAVNFLFRDTIAVKTGLNVDLGNADAIKWQTVRYASPFTGMRKVVMPNMAENSKSVCVRSDEPGPVAVLGLAARIQVNA